MSDSGEKQPLLQPSDPPPGYSQGPPVPSAPPSQPPLYGQPTPLPPSQPPLYGQPSPQVIERIVFGSIPVQTRCPNCHNDVTTVLAYDNGLLTWVAVGVLFLLGFWLCCWIPLLINGLKDVNHMCPNCNRVCGVYKRF